MAERSYLTASFVRTNIGNAKIADNGAAGFKELAFSEFSGNVPSYGKIKTVSFTHYHTWTKNAYTPKEMKIRTTLLSNSEQVSSEALRPPKSTSTEGAQPITNTISNVSTSLMNGLNKIRLEWDSFSSNCDLYYRATEDYPMTLTVDYWPQSVLIPTGASNLGVSFNTPWGANPILGVHTATLSWSSPSDWGGSDTNSNDVFNKQFHLIVRNNYGTEIINTYTGNNSYSFTPNAGQGSSFSYSIETLNDYGNGPTVYSNSFTLYNVGVNSVVSIDCQNVASNPFTKNDGTKLSFNSSYDACFSTEKSFKFDLGKISSNPISCSSQGYAWNISLGYTINGGAEQQTDNFNATSAYPFTAQNYLDQYIIWKIYIHFSITNSSGTEISKQTITYSIPGKARVKIGTEVSIIPSYNWKESLSGLYDGEINFTIKNCISSITKIKIITSLSDSSIHTSTLRLTGSGNKTAKYSFKDNIKATYYKGRKVSSIQYFLLEDNGTEQGFKWNDSETIYTSYLEFPNKTFMSKWKTPVVSLYGDLGENNFYNEAYLSWDYETVGAEMADFATYIDSIHFIRSVHYSYNSEIFKSIPEGTTGSITVSFVDTTYGFPMDSYTIKNVSKVKHVNLLSFDKWFNLPKYSSWTNTGDLNYSSYSFILDDTCLILSNAEELSYNLTISTSGNVKLKIGDSNEVLNNATYSFTSLGDGIPVFVSTQESTEVSSKTLNYFLNVQKGSQVLETLTYSTDYLISNDNLPPFDTEMIKGTADKVFIVDGKSYLIPNFTRVSLTNLIDGVKYQPESARGEGIFTLKDSSNNTLQTAKSSSNQDTISFSTNYSNINLAKDKIISFTKSFSANKKTITSEKVPILSTNSQQVLGGIFSASFNSFDKETPLVVNKENGEIKVRFNYSTLLNDVFRTATNLKVNFFIKIYGSQTQSYLTYSSAQAIPSQETTSITIAFIPTDTSFVKNNSTFTISVVPSIQGTTNGGTAYETFYQGKASTNYTYNIDVPDFAIRKNRVSINREPVVSGGLSSLEIQIANNTNYRYITFFDEIGNEIASFDYIANGIKIDGGSW